MPTDTSRPYPPGTPNYRREAVMRLRDSLNAAENPGVGTRWEPVIPHDSVVTMFPGYVIKYVSNGRRGLWQVEETETP